jgi:hypothetical protein
MSKESSAATLKKACRKRLAEIREMIHYLPPPAGSYIPGVTLSNMLFCLYHSMTLKTTLMKVLLHISMLGMSFFFANQKT